MVTVRLNSTWWITMFTDWVTMKRLEMQSSPLLSLLPQAQEVG